MNTIYLDQTMWAGQAVGGNTGLELPAPRRAAETGGKVIDLAAWKAENLVEDLMELEDEWESGLGDYQGRELVRRRRSRYEALLARGELAATLSVVCVMAALVLRVLVF